MKLFYSPGACSLSADIAFREAGLEVTPVKVDLHTHLTETGEDFYAINPKGYVPALLLDDDTLITEAVAVLCYIADQNSGAHLMPAEGTIERYHALSWLAFVSSELHKNFGTYYNPAATEAMKQTAEQRLQKKFTYLDSQLEGKDYLMGDTFTVADAYAFAILRWTTQFNISISSLKNLSAYVARVRARKVTQEVLAFEGVS